MICNDFQECWLSSYVLLVPSLSSTTSIILRWDNCIIVLFSATYQLIYHFHNINNITVRLLSIRLKLILTSKFSKQRQFCPFCRKFWFVYSFETKTNHECLTTGEQVHLYYLHDDDLHRGLSNSGLLQCLLSHGKHFYRIFIVFILSQHGWDCVLIITFYPAFSSKTCQFDNNCKCKMASFTH